MKHFMRRHTVAGVELPEAAADAAQRLRITHLGSGASFEMTAEFDANGIAETTWTIPPEAKLGDYQIEIADARLNWHESGHFKVEQFRLPTHPRNRHRTGGRAAASARGAARSARRLSIRRRRIADCP